MAPPAELDALEFSLGLVTIQFVLVGYSLCFGPSVHGIIGGLDHIGLQGIEDAAMSADIKRRQIR